MFENTLGSTGYDLFSQDMYYSYNLKSEQGLLFRPTVQWTYAPNSSTYWYHWYYSPMVLWSNSPMHLNHWYYISLVWRLFGLTVHWSEKPWVLQIGTHIRSTALWSCNPIVRQPADHTQYCSLLLQPIGPMLKLRWCMSHQYNFPLVPKPYIWKAHCSTPQWVWHVFRKRKRIAIMITFTWNKYSKPHIVCVTTNWFIFW